MGGETECRNLFLATPPPKKKHVFFFFLLEFDPSRIVIEKPTHSKVKRISIV
jgi:hypothetical protein